MGKGKNNILDFIGKTPIVPIKKLHTNKDVFIFAKLEYFNPGGSVKDRPALSMIEQAEKSGKLTKDKIILEATSGNTGIGLALVSAVKGYRVLLIMSESVSEERIKILRAMGAEIKFTPAHLGTDGAIEYVYQLARKEPHTYWLADQFNNEANWMAHYNGTAMEIWEQIPNVDVIVATMGTTGTLMGISRRFQELKPEVKIIGIEPYLGHKIQGLKNMKESYTPGIFERDRLDQIIHIDDEEAYYMSRLLAEKEGIFVGMSSGAAVAGALRIAKEMKKGQIVVILPDGGERYLSTALFTAKKKSGIFIYNTLSRKKDEFVPIEENQVSIYSCGPTLCQRITLGQVRRLLFSDLIRRYLEFKGFEVTLIMNLTDVDDRTISGAEEEGVSLKEFTAAYHKAFMEDLEQLNVKKATAYPMASEYVSEMIELTQKLLEKGYAYEKFRSIYYDISRFKEYGRLSRIDLNKIKVGKTVDLEQYEKENPRDFTLLKRSTLNELKSGVFYETQWGNVRPSWHIECPAIAMKLLGETYDIHASAVELIFPHHENAIAIGQAVSDKPLANYWLHHEQVIINGGGISHTSEGENLTFRSLLDEGFTGREIRYWLLSRHYRKPIRFSMSALKAARNTVDHLDKFIQKVHASESDSQNPDMDQMVYDLRHKFTESMDDDLNIARAMGALFHFIHQINRIIDLNGLHTADKEKIMKVLQNIDTVLGIMTLEPQEVDKDVEALIEERETARKNKDWNRADELRKKLFDMHIEIIDTKDGPLVRKTGKSSTHGKEGRKRNSKERPL